MKRSQGLHTVSGESGTRDAAMDENSGGLSVSTPVSGL